MAGLRSIAAVVAVVVLMAAGGEATHVQVSIFNRMGKGRSVGIHCQSGDNDLGQQTIPEGGEYGWAFETDVFGTTLFYCDLPGFHFDAYAAMRDEKRCKSLCSWLLAQEGVYGLNQETGLWEFMYQWGN